jgi:hypothetical protein
MVVEGAEEGGEEINKDNIPHSLHQLYTTLCNNYDLRNSVLEGEFSSSILLFFFYFVLEETCVWSLCVEERYSENLLIYTSN